MKLTVALAFCALLLTTTPRRLVGAENHAPSQSTSVKRYKDVGPDEFAKLRANTNAVVLDVRTPKEFAAGHIPGATNMDWYVDFDKQVTALSKNKVYLVHCAAGGRGAKAAERLAQMQFTNVFNLEGGFKAWEKAGKPVERP